MSKKSFAPSPERCQLGWISGFFKRKKRSPQQAKDEDNTSEDSRLMMRRNKSKNLHLCPSEIMTKLKHAIRKEKPLHDKRLLGKTKTIHKSFSNDGDFDPNSARSKQIQINQRRIVYLPEYSSPLRSPGRIWEKNSTVLSTSPSDDFIKSETLPETADDSVTIEEIVTASDDSPFISKTNQIVDGEKEGEVSKETSNEKSLSPLCLLSVASPSHHKAEEYKLVLEPLFIEYEISPARGESQIQPLRNKLQDKNHPMDEKEYVFSYVKSVLDAIGSNWEELYLRTGFSDQLLKPALLSNIPFHPNQICVDHELLFDCINEVLFELCRFPQWVTFIHSRTKVSSVTVESIVCKAQEKVYCHLLPFELPCSVDQILGEDMAKPRNWLDIRCDLECIGFETTELILNVLLEELILDLLVCAFS